MGKCEVCKRANASVCVSDAVGAAVRVCAKCRVRYFPTREERIVLDSAAERDAERIAERECERMAEDGLCGFSY